MKNFEKISLKDHEEKETEEEEGKIDSHHHSSMVREFHDQKKGDFNTETGAVYAPGTRGHDRNLFFVEGGENKEEKREFSENIEHIEELISNINEVELKEEVKGDEAQKEILNEDKEISEELLKDVLSAVEKYINSIKRALTIKQERFQEETDITDYKEKMKIADETRRYSHDSLVDGINILNRFLQNRFGKLSEEKLRNLEKEPKRKLADVERIDIPKNGVCPDNINLSNRKEIAKWAFQVYDSLTELEGLLNEDK